MAIQFKKATKEQSFLRLGIGGPAGSGKTFSALRIATEMAKLKPGKIAVIDTERGSASKYADIFEFDVLELADDHHPERFIEAIKAAVDAGYLYVIIDSTTHEWTGKNGCLELHDIETRKTKNSYTAWNAITPLHNRFFDSILNAKANIIGTVRSKVDHVQEKDSNGKTTIKKVGMASIQREGADYEYDILMEIDVDHFGVITKTRCAALDGKGWKKPGEEIAKILVDWLSSGAAPAPKPEPPAVDPHIAAAKAEMKAKWIDAGKEPDEFEATFQKIYGHCKTIEELRKVEAERKAAAEKARAAQEGGDE